MNTEFDYYDFKKKKEIRYDVNVDLSGVNLQSDAVSSEEENGEIIEVNLNEIVDENINYVYSPEYGSVEFSVEGEDDSEKRFSGQDVIEVQDIDFSDDDNPRSITLGTEELVVPIYPRHESMTDDIISANNVILEASYSIVDIDPNPYNTTYARIVTMVSTETIGFNPFQSEQSYQEYLYNDGFIGVDRIYITIDGADDERLNGEFEISMVNMDSRNVFNIRVPSNFDDTLIITNPGTIVSYRVSTDGYVRRDAIVDRDAYASLGLWDTNSFNTSDDIGISDKRSPGYLSKKQYYNKLSALRTRLSPLGVELITTEYRGNVVDGDDLNYSYLPSSRSFNFDTSVPAARKFIENKQLSDTLTELPSSEITPFTMSFKDAFIAQFASADELKTEFTQVILELISNITSNPLIYSQIDLDSLTSLIEYDVVEYGYSQVENMGTAKTSDGSVVSVYEINPDSAPSTYTVYETYVNDEGDTAFIYNGDDRVPVVEINLVDDLTPSRMINSVENLQTSVETLLLTAGTFSLLFGAGAALLVAATFKAIRVKFDEFDVLVTKLLWFQKYTNQSIFPSGEMLSDPNKEYGDDIVDAGVSDGRIDDSKFKYNKQLARVLIPVDFGAKKEKYKGTNIFGFTVTRYRTVDLGIRWVEVSFLDTNAYSKYRKNDTASGKVFVVNTEFTSLELVDNASTLVRGVLSSPLSDDIIDRGMTDVTVTVTSADDNVYNGTYIAQIIDANTIEYGISDIGITSTSNAILTELISPLMPTQPEDEPSNVRLVYNMPHLPFDSELRSKVFDDFGPFDQSIYANKNRSGIYEVIDGKIVEPESIPGWEIFHPSSKSISDMRSGVDIYNQVQFLLTILENEFTSSRVNLIETTRSYGDQDRIQLGGPSSSFLSWHNHGLAVKIIITELDGITPIKDGSDDLHKLLEIADGFIQGAYNGDYGTSLNVVWCGQLVTNPAIFDWEFLPIGINHKDIIKYRDSAYKQQDPIIANSYVNVTESGYVLNKNAEVPTTPYIREGSKGIKDGIVINGDVWVHPRYIKNYTIPSNLILKDLQEFLSLIRGKMDANGTVLTGKKSINEWKVKNPISFSQLVLFYGITGNLSNARGLLSGDYINKFQRLINTTSDSDPVKFVKTYLGEDEYENTKIYIESLADSSYINLSDGTLTTPVLEARSIQPEGSGNSFGQKQVDYNSVEFGQYQDGVFIPEGDDAIIVIKTENPVIDGYVDGVASEGEAVLLHTLIANQIIEEFDIILANFNNLSIKFMYDSFFEGSNKGLYDLLENEFGVIKTQDLISFDELRDMYDRININSRKIDGDGGVRGAGANIESQNEDDVDRNQNQSVFEKLISNSQMHGVRKSVLTREKPVIDDLTSNVTVEEVIEELKNQRIPKVTDIL